MNLAEINVYRIIHISNIPHVLQNGITHKKSKNRDPNFISIGDISLIETRSSKQVNVDNGIFYSYSTQLITLGDYIPFYFGIKMPMLYVIQHGGNFVEKATSAYDIVYLVCSINRIIQSHSDYYFSDGHATDSLTTFYDSSKISDLPAIIDWNAVKTTYWGGHENLNIKRKKQAEFLTLHDVQPDLIIGFVCYNEAAKNKLLYMGINAEKIRVLPNAFY